VPIEQFSKESQINYYLKFRISLVKALENPT